MFIHELGHAFVASYYGGFRGFTIHGMAFATRIEMDSIPDNRLNTTLCSGMLFNILTMSIIMPLLSNSLSTVFGYTLAVVGCGAGDIYCMFKKEMFEVKK